jgi:hypothetical protein
MRIERLLASILMLFAPYVAAGQSGAPESTRREKAQASSEVDIVGCLTRQSGKLKLTDEDGNVYYLIGQTAGLKSQIGDELDITGIQEHPPAPLMEHSLPETTLRVTNVETVLHKNPAGVRPVLAGTDTWETYTDHKNGVRFRYPKTFEHGEGPDSHAGSNFVDQNDDAAYSFESISVPKKTYPNSNFFGGSFTAAVNPNIRGEGTCGQFSSFWPKRTFARTIRGVKYVQTVSGSVAAGTGSSLYYFHTFQNGSCYEFVFDFVEATGTGIMLTCSLQWVSERNEFALMDALLSQVTFLTPEFKTAVGENSAHHSRPTVVSFEHSPVIGDQSNNVDLSWTTKDADYVELRYPCVENVIVSGLTCGAVTDRNFPGNGSVSLTLGNFNPAPVHLVITVEPFVDGVGYPDQSRTMTIAVRPHPSFGDRR